MATTPVGDLAQLADGVWLVRYTATATAWGLPQPLVGQLEVVATGNQRRVIFAPNDAGADFAPKILWEQATNSSGVMSGRWQRTEKAIMKTAPVVLTAPSGEYPQASSRGAVRLPFTVPCTVSRVRVHMRAWNFRTRKEWGPAILRGLGIAQQDSGGTITGTMWQTDVDGETVDGASEWVSDWFSVGMVEGNTYLLCYGADWQDDVRDLVLGTCWSSFTVEDWDTTDPAVFTNGWGKFNLQPLDIWVECEAPANVPVYGYFGSSNEAGVSQENPVFSTWPAMHARRNRAFAAVTAAGGWSIMDETMHDAAIINRFGYPARLLDRAYLSLGANIEARGATAAEAIVEMERWMNVRPPALGSPPTYLLTQIASPTASETSDTVGTLSDWNEWCRWTGAARPEVVGLIDQAAIFADPDKPWTARVELRASPTDVHFSDLGQKLRARAVDGEVTLPVLTARDATEMPYDSGLRAIESMLPGGAAAWEYNATNPCRVRLMRMGNLVSLSVQNIYNSSGATGVTTLITLPLGFRPAATEYQTTFRGRNATITTAGAFRIYFPATPGTEQIDQVTFTYMTLNSPRPGQEPGTPA